MKTPATYAREGGLLFVLLCMTAVAGAFLSGYIKPVRDLSPVSLPGDTTVKVEVTQVVAPAAPIPVQDLKCPAGWAQVPLNGGNITQAGIGYIACDRSVRGESWNLTLNADAQRSRVLARYKPLPPLSVSEPTEVDAKLAELAR